MMRHMMTRRGFGAVSLAAAAVALMSGPVAALTESSARTLVQQLVDEINGVIASGASQAKMIDRFEDIFKRYADTSYVAAYAMGTEARRATAQQKSAFSDAFNTYVARKYGKRFQEFAGGQLEVTEIRDRKKFYEVVTLAKLPGQSPFEVTFLISDRSGKDQFYNIFVEGVNMLLPERDEVGALLDANGGDIDKMIAALRKKG